MLCVFDCNPGESERLARQIAEWVESKMRFHPGFLSSMIYLSEDGGRIVELFQWARAEDWQAYRATDDGHTAVAQMAGRSPRIEFLEMIQAVGAPLPGESGVRRGIDLPDAS